MEEHNKRGISNCFIESCPAALQSNSEKVFILKTAEKYPYKIMNNCSEDN